MMMRLSLLITAAAFATPLITPLGAPPVALADALPPSTSTATPAAVPPARSTARAQNLVIPKLSVNSQPLSRVLDYLARASGANVVVNWPVLEAAGVSRDTPITMNVSRVTLRKMLTLVLDQASPQTPLAFDVADNVLTITTQAKADQTLVVHVYPVADLTMPHNTDINLSSGINGGGPSGGGAAPAQAGGQTMAQRGQDLVNLIRETIRPDIWKIKGGPASVTYLNGNLILSAPRSVHALIGGPLEK
jgi:hypothetical protein